MKSAIKQQEDSSKVYGRILGEVGGSSLTIPDLRWEMAPRSVSVMICGVGVGPQGCISGFIRHCVCKGCFCCGLKFSSGSTQ